MCGICGMIGFEDKELLKRMCDVISYRGPNDSGAYIDKNVGLGNRRLSIIDLAGGHQPVHNEDETIWVTYNGEIYNYKELKESLEKLGHNFYTNSDTEVLIHLYENFGDYFVKKLRGMFAFAIWDRNKKKLLLGRDRLGIKPLYYTINDGNFFFGSEIKSILQFEEIKRSVNFHALHEFLTLQYVPGPETMFRNIKKLQPGHILTYQKGKIIIKKYWDIKIEPLIKMEENACSEHILNLLKDSVKMRLMSEVPLGVYLSGGLDSSAIVAIMSMVSDEPVKTYTVGFDHPTDEFKYAKIIAEQFNTDHQELIVKADTTKILPEIVWHFDEPNADPASLPTYLMSKITKKKLTVVLVGEGGDETFAGYQKYKIMLMTSKYKYLFPKSTAYIASALSRFVPNKNLRKYLEFASEFIPLIGKDSDAYQKISALGFTQKEKNELYSKKLRNLKLKENSIKTYLTGSYDLFKRMMSFDMKVWLCDRLLMKVDKMTMASSIEARVPLLDHKLVEFANTIPVNLRLEKRVFKRAVSKILPKVIVKRKKHGFAVPISTWFEGELKEIAIQVLDKLHKQDYFRYNYIQDLLKNPQKFRNNHKLWNLLNFDIWHKIYIENDDMKNPKLDLNDLVV